MMRNKPEKPETPHWLQNAVISLINDHGLSAVKVEALLGSITMTVSSLRPAIAEYRSLHLSEPEIRSILRHRYEVHVRRMCENFRLTAGQTDVILDFAYCVIDYVLAERSRGMSDHH